MCGFIGAFSKSNINKEQLELANKHIVCRGPDSLKQSHVENSEINHSLIFNRLSILDLSHKADQPMSSDRNIIMFNGEIYNAYNLRKKLEGQNIRFKTDNSDTEVVLKGIEKYGVDFVNQLRGMFAIFYLDQVNKVFYLIRDRLGQKPLYYYKNENSFSFASNLKSLLKINNFKEISSEQLSEYLVYGAVASPNTLFKDYRSIRPAEILKVDYSNNSFNIRTSTYWDPQNYLDDKKFDNSEFNEILSESINIRNVADVPIASFLSGGIDSTSIVKHLSKTDKQVNTFSIHVENEKYDESKWSNEVAQKYNTNHRYVTIDSTIDNKIIDKSIKSLDHPYSDPSVIPSFMLSEEISKYFKVAISGDGGDELLGGYKRLNLTLSNKNLIDQFISNFYSFYPAFMGTGNYFLSKSTDIKKSYSSFLEDKKLLNLLNLKNSSFKENIIINNSMSSYKQLLYADYKFYLPEMMMFKIDRTSMANSLEIRSPFVDHNLVEYIFAHNTEYYEPSRPKSLLKNNLQEDFDLKFLERSKQGFVFDIENWIYKNTNLVEETFKNGALVNNLNKNILSSLSKFKSRINAQRIWKLYVLEKYLDELD